MLVVIDVGNTNITLGVYDQDELIANFRLTTKLQRTSDEFGITLFSFFQTKNIEPIIVGPGIKTGISVKTENPREVGADRIVDIAAAYHIYGGPALVIDFGTATTYDYVNENGEFEFGVTSPGIEISAQALWTQAAKLPEIEIKKPATIMCRNTITSMQGGLVYGYIGQTEYIIKKVKEAVGKDIKVVATGGLGRIIYNETDMIDIYDPDLAFKGMKVIYHKTKG